MSPGAVDRVLVRRHLLALDTALRVLRDETGVSLDTMKSDLKVAWTIERGLQLCAQNALDIAVHVAASRGADVADYTKAIDALGALGILPADFAQRFRGVAGFRNVLVHGYLEVDLAKVHALLHDRLDDFAEFARHIDQSLGEK